MDFAGQKIPPIREDRLGAWNAFGGTCGELSRQAKQGCLNCNQRSFTQTQGCQLILSLAILATIRDSVIIVHGPIGCGGGNIAVANGVKAFQRLRDPGARGLIWLNTNLDETDVITGGEEKLRAAILHADRKFKPGAIIVVNSCTPGIIGDDIDGVAENLKGETVATIVPVHCEGFKTRIMASAYDSIYHGVLRNLVPGGNGRTSPLPGDRKIDRPSYRDSRRINLLNVSSMSRLDEVELTRLLSKLGLEPRILPCYAHPGDFSHVLDAALNVSICSTHDDYFTGHLEEKYGIPMVSTDIPVGIDATARWLRDIAARFDLQQEAERLIATETERLEKALESYKEQFRGKRAYVAGGEIRIFATAELLARLGFQIVGLHGFHYDRFADTFLENLPDRETLKISIGSGQPFEQSNILKKLKPDLFVGHLGINGWGGKHGIPVLAIFGQGANYMGYSGVFEIARKLLRILKNPLFCRNIGANARLPYVKEWYGRDAYSYLEAR
jgi:nitrogenase molybdenum-iron protein alpha chain